RLAHQRVVRDIGLKTAALATPAESAIELDLRVTELHAESLAAAIDAMVHHEAHADPVLDGEHREIRQAAAGAEPQLGERHEVRVVVHVNRPTEPLARGSGKRRMAAR